MFRFEESNYKNNYTIDEIFDRVSKYGYKYILLANQTYKQDPFILASYLASKYDNLIFIVAVRPYNINPRYLSMIISTFQELYGDRLIINLVAGTFDDEEILFTGNNSGIENRKNQLIEIAKIIKQETKIKPKIIFGGSSQKTIDATNLYGDAILMKINDYLSNMHIEKEIILRVFLSNQNGKEDHFITGSNKEICNKIKMFKDTGISHILISWDDVDDQLDNLGNITKILTSL